MASDGRVFDRHPHFMAWSQSEHSCFAKDLITDPEFLDQVASGPRSSRPPRVKARAKRPVEHQELLDQPEPGALAAAPAFEILAHADAHESIQITLDRRGNPVLPLAGPSRSDQEDEQKSSSDDALDHCTEGSTCDDCGRIYEVAARLVPALSVWGFCCSDVSQRCRSKRLRGL